MKTTIGRSFAAALAMAAFSYVPAQAQELSCDDIDFVGEIGERFPNANEACLEIVERNGEQFAHYNAEIQRVSGNNVKVKFNLPDGSKTQTFAFDMPADARVEVQGRKYRYRDLGRGSDIDIYVPPDRWEVHIPHDEDFATSSAVAVATPMAVADDDMGEETVAMLPSTASPLPLIGLLGALFTGMGALLVGVRRRLSK